MNVNGSFYTNGKTKYSLYASACDASAHDASAHTMYQRAMYQRTMRQRAMRQRMRASGKAHVRRAHVQKGVCEWGHMCELRRSRICGGNWSIVLRHYPPFRVEAGRGDIRLKEKVGVFSGEGVPMTVKCQGSHGFGKDRLERGERYDRWLRVGSTMSRIERGGGCWWTRSRRHPSCKGERGWGQVVKCVATLELIGDLVGR
jgi:hypothetical protein